MWRIPLLAVALMLAIMGCGGDDDDGGSADKPAASTPAETTQAVPPTNDSEAIKQTVSTYLTGAPDCDLLTDRFLEEGSIGDTREARCDYYKQAAEGVSIEESEVELSDPEIKGLSATIVQTGSQAKTEYTLVKQGGTWRIDAEDVEDL